MSRIALRRLSGSAQNECHRAASSLRFDLIIFQNDRHSVLRSAPTALEDHRVRRSRQPDKQEHRLHSRCIPRDQCKAAPLLQTVDLHFSVGGCNPPGRRQRRQYLLRRYTALQLHMPLLTLVIRSYSRQPASYFMGCSRTLACLSRLATCMRQDRSVINAVSFHIARTVQCLHSLAAEQRVLPIMLAFRFFEPAKTREAEKSHRRNSGE